MSRTTDFPSLLLDLTESGMDLPLAALCFAHPQKLRFQLSAAFPESMPGLLQLQRGVLL